MKMYAISDNVDTSTGLKLVGIEGVVVHTLDELKQQLEQVMKNPEIGIVLITEKLAGEFPEIIKEIKLNRTLPILVEIPDRHGTGRAPDFITAYIREAIGVKL